jgi:hypothetical protein
MALLVFFIVAAIRLLHIKLFAVDLPWSDQWDGEIERIYFKALDGTLSIGDFWAQANEHRIVWTKLLNFLAFKLSGDQFNQIHALYLQSLVFAAIPAVLAYYLNLERPQWLATALLTFLFIPVLDPENAYWSYQSQVYFAMLFGVIGVYFVSKTPRSPLAILLITCVAGMANGAAFYIPVLALCAVILSWERNMRSVWAGLFYAVLAFCAYKVFTAATPWHDQFKATSIPELVRSLLQYTAWPMYAGWFFWAGLLGLVIWSIKKFFVNSMQSSTQRYGFFLALYFFLFLVSSIYARAGFMGIPSRYFAYYLLGFSAFLFFNYKIRFKRYIVFFAIFLCVCFQAPRSYMDWQNYAATKTIYRTNFIETLYLASGNSYTRDNAVLNNMTKIPMPYAGYPNYVVPYRVLIDPKSQQIFKYLINQPDKSNENNFTSP